MSGKAKVPTHEILRHDWSNFFDSFSRQHEGWLAILELLDPDIGAQEEVHDGSLEGVSIASGNDAKDRITISMGKRTGDHLSHSIDRPTHVWLQQISDGVDAALLIESENQP